MIAVPAGVRIVVASRPVDFRNGLDGLAALVQQALRENPFVGDLFVFRAKRADRVKILTWDGTGLCLFHKRLEKGRFVWPPVQDGVIRVPYSASHKEHAARLPPRSTSSLPTVPTRPMQLPWSTASTLKPGPSRRLLRVGWALHFARAVWGPPWTM